MHSSIGNIELNFQIKTTEQMFVLPKKKSEICFQSIRDKEISSYTLDFDNAKNFCETLGHSLLVLDSEMELQRISKKMENLNISNSDFWTGFTDRLSEGRFLNAYDSSERKLNIWNNEGPNGGPYQNCLSVSLMSNSSSVYFTDTSCQDSQRFLCKVAIPARPIGVRGLSMYHSNLVDSIFAYDLEKDIFQGLKKSKISYNQGSWKIYSKVGEMVAQTKFKFPYLPLGSHEWIFIDNATVMLSLNSCNETEFPCANGICLPVSDKCDQEHDCPGEDYSDEEGCDLVKLPIGYKNVIPPPNLQVDLYFEITDVLNMDVTQNNFETEIKVISMWRDGRLSFKNLNDKMNMNLLKYNILKRIWVPSITFENTKQKISSNKIDSEYNNLVYVKKRVNTSSTDISSEVVKNFVFDGDAVNIIKRSRYNIKPICDYTFKIFPFDTQICSFEIYPDSGQKDQITFEIYQQDDENAENLNIFTAKENINFLEYSLGKLFILKTNATDDTSVQYQKIYLVFTMKRNMQSVIIKTFIPTGLLVLISQLTTYFMGDEMFDGIIAVNATILMTLATLFVDSFNSMPTSSYVK